MPKCHVTFTKKDAYIRNELQFQNHSLTYFHKNNSLHSADSILSRSSLADISSSALAKLLCTDLVDFGKCQDRFGQQRIPTGTKFSKGTVRLQPVFD